ncbi:hypothetical protein RvY_12794 [Ramazzottius varieornatus]|uniref:Uncharacterized protein n=1 Tax=Ramazzottius varieornatus TaxID=947166 RepID=A0A1D1VUE0_RAMVA|nr:hypothetical protein RvY_12794 [Ramazzottius varieornatus]
MQKQSHITLFNLSAGGEYRVAMFAFEGVLKFGQTSGGKHFVHLVCHAVQPHFGRQGSVHSTTIFLQNLGVQKQADKDLLRQDERTVYDLPSRTSHVTDSIRSATVRATEKRRKLHTDDLYRYPWYKFALISSLAD